MVVVLVVCVCVWGGGTVDCGCCTDNACSCLKPLPFPLSLHIPHCNYQLNSSSLIIVADKSTVVPLQEKCTIVVVDAYSRVQFPVVHIVHTMY